MARRKFFENEEKVEKQRKIVNTLAQKVMNSFYFLKIIKITFELKILFNFPRSIYISTY